MVSNIGKNFSQGLPDPINDVVNLNESQSQEFNKAKEKLKDIEDLTNRLSAKILNNQLVNVYVYGDKTPHIYLLTDYQKIQKESASEEEPTGPLKKKQPSVFTFKNAIPHSNQPREAMKKDSIASKESEATQTQANNDTRKQKTPKHPNPEGLTKQQKNDILKLFNLEPDDE